MRALTIRPDDADLFQHFADPEKYGFFLSHLSAFKRMWEAEGKVYWLRFLLCLKENFENSTMHDPAYDFLFDLPEEEQLQGLIYINIHKKFVQASYSVTKSFMEQAFVLTKNLTNLREPHRMKNPFYTKETREAFRDLLGKPEVDEDIPCVPVALLASIYAVFVGSVCTLLKRWLKEPDLSDAAKKNLDYTHFYWKPPPSWTTEDFFPTCFEKYLSDTYKDDLPKILLTKKIHEIFQDHPSECPCVSNRDNINIFDVLRNCPDVYNDDSEGDGELEFTMEQKGYLQPKVQICPDHSNCRQKVLHSSNCSEPYLCEGSKVCKITCEKTQKGMQVDVQPTSSFKKITAENFTCKENKRKRHASTFVQSHNTQVETFLHKPESEIIKDVQELAKIKQIQDEDDFLNRICDDPEFMNLFYQHKRKATVRNRLRNKFQQKYGFNPEEYKDPDFRLSLYDGARKLWISNRLSEELHENTPSFCGHGSHKKWDYKPGSVLNSVKSAETTVAVGTHGILTGRIVTATPSLFPAPKNIKPPEPAVVSPAPVESKSKSKKSKKKKKAGANNVSDENKDNLPTSTGNPASSSAAQQTDKSAQTNKVSPAAVNTNSARKDVVENAKQVIANGLKQVIAKNPTSIHGSTSDESLKNCDKSQDKGSSLNIKKTVDMSLDNKSKSDKVTKDVKGKGGTLDKEVKSKGDTVTKEVKSKCDTVTKEVKGKGDAVTKEVKGKGDTVAKDVKCKGDPVAKEVKSKGDTIAEGNKSNSDMVARNKSDGTKVELSDTGGTRFVVNGDDVEDISKLKKISNSKAEVTKDGSQLDDKVEQYQEPLDLTIDVKDKAVKLPLDLTIDVKDKAVNQNVHEKPTAEKKLKDNSSSDNTVIQNVVKKEKLKNDCAKDGTVNESQDKTKGTLKDSIDNQTVAQKQGVPNKDLSSDSQDKLINENGVAESPLNEVEEVSDAVLLEANSALNKLKFNKKEDKPVEDFLKLIGVLKDNKPETKRDGEASLSNATNVMDKKQKFKTCAFCSKKEVTPKTFKRCAKCKAENFPVQRYYCSRECQIDDWQKSHRDEHSNNK